MAIENYHKTMEAAREVAAKLIALVPTVPLAIVFFPADEVMAYDNWTVVREDWLQYSSGKLVETVHGENR